MESLKYKLLSYLPKDRRLNDLHFLWPVINYSGGISTETSYVWNIGSCLESMMDPKFQVYLWSYTDKLGNFHPIFLFLLWSNWFMVIKTEAYVFEKGKPSFWLSFKWSPSLELSLGPRNVYYFHVVNMGWVWKMWSEVYVWFYFVASLGSSQGNLVL